MEPILGLASEYGSNPELRVSERKSEVHGALLLTLPVSYDLDALHLGAVVDGRLSDSRGFASLSSNYLRVNADARVDRERGYARVSAGFSRDTSLYHSGESARGVGVRRDTRAAGLQLEHLQSEKLRGDLDVSWSRVVYDQSANLTNLVDYRYLSVGPSVTAAVDERDELTLSGGIGRYRSLNQITESDSYDLQLGGSRRLSEHWSVDASAGYSRSKNRQKVFFGPFFLGTRESTQNGAVYDAHLRHRGERTDFSLSASRALKPTGFAFLSRQESVAIATNYARSERWTFYGHVQWARTADPQFGGGTSTRRYASLDGAASWTWTPVMKFTLRASVVEQRYGAAVGNADSTGVSLEFVRLFGRMNL
jgi:hypothetical protein